MAQLLIFIAFAAILVFGALRVVKALRSGTVRHSWFVHERAAQPARYWFGIAAYLVALGVFGLLFIQDVKQGLWN